MARYAQIVFGLPLRGTFDYAIPASLEKEVEVGKRVFVPFRNKKILGYCVGINKKSKSFYTKEIISVLDREAIFSERFLAFLKLISEKYFASWGEMITSATPVYLRKPRKTPLKEEENYKVSDSKLNLSFYTQRIIKDIERGKNKFFVFDDYFQKKRINLYYEISLWMLKQGKDVLILTPEIYTAEEWWRFLREKFTSSKIILYHSRLKEKEGFLAWWEMRKKEPKIVVGTRIAVFYPGENLGMIILEEENSPFHKQEEFPFYNTREVALYRSRYFKIPLIYTGSSPSVETYYKVKRNLFSLIDLREKPEQLPKISVVDLGITGKKIPLTKALELKIADILKMGKKVVIFLNRRGFATSIFCKKCGKVLRCGRCEKNLIYHFSSRKLVCHYCETVQKPISLCPDCKAGYLRYKGLGTEKLESELSRLFPQTKISRIDLDVKEEKMIDKVLRDFAEGKTDILITTSLITKLPILKNIGLLGIVNLEQGISFPDFRMGERLFSLLVNLLRLVRGERGWEDFLIQTHNPQSALINALRDLDYEMFYREELNLRKELKLPPFRNLIIINLKGKNKKSVENNAKLFAERLKKGNNYKGVFISEAVPHPLFKLRGKYNWQIFIKSAKIKNVFNLLEEVLKGKRKFKGSVLTVDVEPG
ncbi:MAG: primosomal protein N' [Candidatus Omnitrophica bacterium]|nr:primosomal protein N' [Candidatus Omnitrophota bacterium]MCM8793284.1 primosomal protein N' [Candidatus Omnitrophota bacterium]